MLLSIYGKDKYAHNCRHAQTTLQPSKVEAFSEICPRVYGLIRLNSHTLTSLIGGERERAPYLDWGEPERAPPSHVSGCSLGMVRTSVRPSVRTARMRAMFCKLRVCDVSSKYAACNVSEITRMRQ